MGELEIGICIERPPDVCPLGFGRSRFPSCSGQGAVAGRAITWERPVGISFRPFCGFVLVQARLLVSVFWQLRRWHQSLNVPFPSKGETLVRLTLSAGWPSLSGTGLRLSYLSSEYDFAYSRDSCLNCSDRRNNSAWTKHSCQSQGPVGWDIPITCCAACRPLAG